MSGLKLNALTALVRWRDFAETRASDAFRRCNEEVLRARQESDEAKDKLDDIQHGRMQMLSASSIDLALLQFAADIEEAVWNVAQERRAELEAAEGARDAAQSAYVEARAQTQVVETRHERLAAVENDRQEKTMFDWMADLYTQTRSAPR